jgi:hypothetical protein
VPTGPTVLERSGGDFRLPAPARDRHCLRCAVRQADDVLHQGGVCPPCRRVLLLTVMLWLFGQGLQQAYPQLLKMKILIYVPQ